MRSFASRLGHTLMAVSVCGALLLTSCSSSEDGSDYYDPGFDLYDADRQQELDDLLEPPPPTRLMTDPDPHGDYSILD